MKKIVAIVLAVVIGVAALGCAYAVIKSRHSGGTEVEQIMDENGYITGFKIKYEGKYSELKYDPNSVKVDVHVEEDPKDEYDILYLYIYDLENGNVNFSRNSFYGDKNDEEHDETAMCSYEIGDDYTEVTLMIHPVKEYNSISVFMEEGLFVNEIGMPSPRVEW